MSAGYLFFVNVSLGVLFFAIFCGAYLHDRRRRDAFWWLMAFVSALVSAGFELSLTHFNWAHGPRFFLFASHLGALIFYCAGIAAHYRQPFAWRTALLFFGVSLALNLAIIDMERASALRQTLYQLPYFAAAFTGAVLIWRYRRGRVDLLFFGAALLFALQFGLRPVLAFLTGGMGFSPSAYLTTSYGAVTQMLITLTTMSTAAVMVGLIVRDVYRDLKRLALADGSSGLASQAGFKKLAVSLLAKPGGTKVPFALAMIVPDSSWSAIATQPIRSPDRHGVLLGSIISQTVRDGDIAGLCGDGGFAILLRDCDSMAARLWCENLRTVFSARQNGAQAASVLINGQPFATLSAGVVRRRNSESLDSLLARASEAVFHAQQLGGDMVCVRDKERYVVPSLRQAQ